jgi:hypothetical protein
MKYILMMNGAKADFARLFGWSKEDFRAHCAYLIALTQELRESGVLAAVEGLALPDEARVVRAGPDGMPITDGVFPESKEFLASFSIVDVETPEQAYAIAARVSAAPGPGGGPLNMPIEVRQVMSGPPPELQ